MMTVDLYITKNTVGARCAGIALLAVGNYKKAIAKCFSASIPFEALFEQAVETLKYPCSVNLYSDCKAFDVQCAVMRENVKGKHRVSFLDKKGTEVIGWLKFVAYEAALNRGFDEFLLKEAMGEVLN
jgi:hypothetical protein